MEGKEINYELKRGYSSRFNQKMFGRISRRKVGEDKYNNYYIPGVLDEIPYYRIFKGKIFIGITEQIDFDPILRYCTKFEVSTAHKDENNLHMKTGRDKWKFHARERGYYIDWDEE